MPLPSDTHVPGDTGHTTDHNTIIDAIAALQTGTVLLAGIQTITGTKTFTASPTVPAPTSAGQAATKGYVDTSVVFSVKAYGAAGDGVTDDTTAIQNTINASVEGSLVWFPVGTYLISASIVLAGGRRYAGTHRLGSKIKVANGANLTAAVTSASVVATGATAGDDPIQIAHLQVDGNSANQTAGTGHGISIRCFWGDLDDVEVTNARGVGIRLTTAANDSTELAQQGPENRVHRCVVRGAGSHGFHVSDPDPGNEATNGLTDGWMVDCVVGGCAGDGIRIDCGAGWAVTGCHIYGAAQHGINACRGGSLRIVANYIETCGSTSVAGWWALVCVGDSVSGFIGAGGGIEIAHNVGFYDGVHFPAQGSNNILAILANVSSGVAAQMNIVGNTFDAIPAGSECVNAVWVSLPNSSTTAKIRRSGNAYGGWTTNLGLSSGSATLAQFAIEREEFFAQSVAYAGTITPDPSLGEDIIVGTLTGAVTVNTPNYPYVGQRVALSFLEDATGGRTITLNGAYKANWTPVTTASKRNTAEFVCVDAATPVYVQTAGIVGI